MKIKVTQSISSIAWSYRRGQIVEVEDAEAVRLLNAGFASPIADEPTVETAAVKPKVERAAKQKKAE